MSGPVRIEFQCTKAEYDTIRTAARQAGVTMTAYIKMASWRAAIDALAGVQKTPVGSGEEP